jgi:hypothetical protein
MRLAVPPLLLRRHGEVPDRTLPFTARGVWSSCWYYWRDTSRNTNVLWPTGVSWKSLNWRPQIFVVQTIRLLSCLYHSTRTLRSLQYFPFSQQHNQVEVYAFHENGTVCMKLDISATKLCSPVYSSHASCSGDSEFESEPGTQLPWLRIFIVLRVFGSFKRILR